MGKRKFEMLSHRSQSNLMGYMDKICSNWEVETVGDCIPADIQMRAYGVNKYKEIPDQTEPDARNWGLLLICDLHKISVLRKGNLEFFQKDLRDMIEKRSPDQPYVTPDDIRKLKAAYENYFRNQALRMGSNSEAIPTIVYKSQRRAYASKAPTSKDKVKSTWVQPEEDPTDDEEDMSTYIYAQEGATFDEEEEEEEEEEAVSGGQEPAAKRHQVQDNSESVGQHSQNPAGPPAQDAAPSKSIATQQAKAMASVRRAPMSAPQTPAAAPAASKLPPQPHTAPHTSEGRNDQDQYQEDVQPFTVPRDFAVPRVSISLDSPMGNSEFVLPTRPVGKEADSAARTKTASHDLGAQEDSFTPHMGHDDCNKSTRSSVLIDPEILAAERAAERAVERAAERAAAVGHTAKRAVAASQDAPAGRVVPVVRGSQGDQVASSRRVSQAGQAPPAGRLAAVGRVSAHRASPLGAGLAAGRHAAVTRVSGVGQVPSGGRGGRGGSGGRVAPLAATPMTPGAPDAASGQPAVKSEFARKTEEMREKRARLRAATEAAAAVPEGDPMSGEAKQLKILKLELAVTQAELKAAQLRLVIQDLKHGMDPQSVSLDDLEDGGPVPLPL